MPRIRKQSFNVGFANSVKAATALALEHYRHGPRCGAVKDSPFNPKRSLTIIRRRSGSPDTVVYTSN